MSQFSAQSNVFHARRGGIAALLVTGDAVLFLDLQAMFLEFGIALTRANSAREALSVIRVVEDVDYLLLDGRLTAVADGSLLAALGDWSAHRRGAIAVIAHGPGEDWIERLRQGVIDDLMAATADSLTWRARLSAMERNRSMHLELDTLRLATQAELERDPATGAISREMMLKLLFRETDRVQRLRGELSLLLFAVAGLRKEPGCEGDSLLREVAARTGRALRTYDLLGRTGESEFLIALPGCGVENARALARRLRVEIFGEPFLVRTIREGFERIELDSIFAVTPSDGRSPLVVLREAELSLEQARRNAAGSRLDAGHGGRDDLRSGMAGPRVSQLLSSRAGVDREELHGVG